jgi:hypothetical protein
VIIYGKATRAQRGHLFYDLRPSPFRTTFSRSRDK